jgi:glycosyltransferase involved in cell wall biosynthesis
MRSGAKVVHFHDPEFIAAGLALKLMGRKVVYDVHEYYSEVQAHRVSGGPLLQGAVGALVSLFVEQIPARLFDRVVFPTYMLRDAVYPGKRSEVLVNLLAVDVIADEGRVPVTPDHDVVFVGSISPFRAGPLMEMMKHILLVRSDARLLMVGAPEATVRWMREHAPSPEVLSAITFHPRVPHAQVKGLLARGKIGFNYHPMQRRFQVALPMKVYEYMAVELPVVVSRFPELERQFVEGEEIVFVNGDDQQDFASAVLRLLEDPERSRRLGRAGCERLLSEHNWEVSEARKLAAMYEALLET